MNQTPRFEWTPSGMLRATPETADSHWVRADDFDSLLAKCGELVVVLKKCTNALDKYAGSLAQPELVALGRAIIKSVTP